MIPFLLGAVVIVHARAPRGRAEAGARHVLAGLVVLCMAQSRIWNATATLRFLVYRATFIDQLRSFSGVVD